MFLNVTPRILIAAALVVVSASHGALAQDAQSGWGNVEVVPEPEAPKKKKKPAAAAKPVTPPAAAEGRADKSKATAGEAGKAEEAASEANRASEKTAAPPAETVAKPDPQEGSPPQVSEPAAAKAEAEAPAPAAVAAEPVPQPAKADAAADAPANTAAAPAQPPEAADQQPPEVADQPDAGEPASNGAQPAQARRKAVSAAPGLVVVTPDLPIGMQVPDSLMPRAPSQ